MKVITFTKTMEWLEWDEIHNMCIDRDDNCPCEHWSQCQLVFRGCGTRTSTKHMFQEFYESLDSYEIKECKQGIWEAVDITLSLHEFFKTYFNNKLMNKRTPMKYPILLLLRLILIFVSSCKLLLLS